MGKALIIAEKPSVAVDIAKAIGGFKKQDDYYESDDPDAEEPPRMAAIQKRLEKLNAGRKEIWLKFSASVPPRRRRERIAPLTEPSGTLRIDPCSAMPASHSGVFTQATRSR